MTMKVGKRLDLAVMVLMEEEMVDYKDGDS